MAKVYSCAKREISKREVAQEELGIHVADFLVNIASILRARSIGTRPICFIDRNLALEDEVRIRIVVARTS